MNSLPTKTESIIDMKNYQEELIKLIRHRFGIKIHGSQIKELNKIIIDACQKFFCEPECYINLLSESKDGCLILEDLMSRITVGETYFFRDKHQMKLLQERILPTIIKKKRNENNLSLRIWSAGCATGEEIYTIAIILTELLPDIKKWKLQLLGTDINTIALKNASKGSYNEWSMRSISDYYKKNYFQKDNNHRYAILEKILPLVDFDYLNLNDNTYPSIFNGTNAQDLIICRNVLIYFNEENIQHIMKRFSACLIEGGYLLLGSSDPIYIKEANLSFIDSSLFMHKTIEKTTIHQEKNHIINPTIATTKEIKNKVKEKTPLPVSAKLAPEITDEIITSYIKNGCFQEALKAIDLYENSHKQNRVFVLNSKATILANLGNLDEAIKLCEMSIKIDSTNIETHFILAMALIEINKIYAAEKELRKVIFLNNKFVEAHFQLGLLLLRAKKHDSGIKSLHNAVQIAKGRDPGEPVSGFQGLNYGRLTEILQRELELHTTQKG